MQAALQQDTGAAQLQHLFNFFVDRFKRKDVTVFGAERPVEGAEGTVLGAEVGVIDVAIDLVGDHARVVLGQAQLMRFMPRPTRSSDSSISIACCLLRLMGSETFYSKSAGTSECRKV